jgi:adenylate cyclase
MYAALFSDPDFIFPTPTLAGGPETALAQNDARYCSIGRVSLSNTAHSETRDAPVRIRHYPRDHSLFADGQYLIRGVAGAVLWKLLREYQELGRTEFSSRELRAAGKELGLPEIGDNLSVRLRLLANRLDQLEAPIRLNRLGGGLVQLAVTQAIVLDLA